MKKILFILSISLLAISCTEKRQEQKIIYNNGPFDSIRAQGEALAKDSAFVKSIDSLK